MLCLTELAKQAVLLEAVEIIILEQRDEVANVNISAPLFFKVPFPMSIDIDLAIGALNKAASRLSEQLTAPLVKSLTMAADELSYSRSKNFVLMPMNPVRVVLALSGGRDSMSMLDVVSRFFYRPRQCLVSRLRVIYVHHGLSPNADAWALHCERESRKRGIPFELIRVKVNAKEGGVEAAARAARYRALEESALQHGDDVVLTAHHEDDRLETFLLQLLRGAGPDGLAAFPETRRLRLPGDSLMPAERPILLLRPWRQIPRTTITAYATAAKLIWVEDESNLDVAYDRNRIRHEVMPKLTAMTGAFRAKANQSMLGLEELVEALHSVSAMDLERIRVPEHAHTISVTELKRLSEVRQRWCIRALCQKAGAVPPSEAKLADALRQIHETSTDSDLTVALGAHEIRRWGDWLLVQKADRWSMPVAQQIYITHESVIPLPEWGGEIHVQPAELGEPALCLESIQSEPLWLKGREGGEKMKVKLNRPTKSLKDLYAERKIPSFLRDRYPLLWSQDGKLLFVAGLGMNVNHTEIAKPDELHYVKLKFLPQ